MKFTSTVNTIVQALGVSAQILNAISPLIPEEYRGWVAAIIATMQGISARAAHFRNPDGGPAAEAWNEPAS